MTRITYVHFDILLAFYLTYAIAKIFNLEFKIYFFIFFIVLILLIVGHTKLRKFRNK